MEEVLVLVIALLILLRSSALSYLFHQLCLRSENIRKKLRRQGVKGPEPTFLYGNTREMKMIQQELKPVQMQDANNYLSTIFPHFLLWKKTYGPVFLYSTGALEILHVSDPDMVKVIGHLTPSELGKPNYLKRSRKALFGGGLFMVNGDEWAYQRKIFAPEFFMDKIKGMIQLIEDATVPLVEAWESLLGNVGGSREIVVDDYLRNLSADVIARACFGSSFTRGKEIFSKLRQLQKAVSQQDALVGLSALWNTTTARIMAFCAPSSTTHTMVVAMKALQKLKPSSLANCKAIYFAGHGTTAVTIIWCLMLLAAHPEWQERAQAEALEVCQGRTTLDVDILCQLKIITMVIQETLRLYPPASLMMREALADIRIGGLDVPHGTIIQVARSMLHLDKDTWGLGP